MRWQVIALGILLWNMAILLDRYIFEKGLKFYWTPDEHSRIGLLWPVLVFLIFILSIAIWHSSILQKYILKPGTNPRDIKDVLYITSIISGGVLFILTIAYLKFGFLIWLTDPNGNVTSYIYDASGNLQEKTDPMGHVTTYTHDANGMIFCRTKSSD